MLLSPQTEMRALRSRLGFATLDDLVLDSLDQCLLPGERRRLKEWQAVYCSKGEANKPFIVDVSQNVGFSAFGASFPTLTRHMLLTNLMDNRLVTSNEMFLSQGHPVLLHGPGSCFEGLPSEHSGLAWRNCYRELSRRDRLALLGNGQHIASTGCFSLWSLSNLIHVDDLDYDFDFIGEHRMASKSLDQEFGQRLVVLDVDEDQS